MTVTRKELAIRQEAFRRVRAANPGASVKQVIDLVRADNVIAQVRDEWAQIDWLAMSVALSRSEPALDTLLGG